jgi:hypothetical protein
VAKVLSVTPGLLGEKLAKHGEHRTEVREVTPWSVAFRRAFLSCDANGRAGRDRLKGRLIGDEAVGEVETEAPAQAELRPTCAEASPYLRPPNAFLTWQEANRDLRKNAQNKNKAHHDPHGDERESADWNRGGVCWRGLPIHRPDYF